MKTKYDWSNVPEEIKYGVTDALGRYLGFIEKPESTDKYCVMWCDYFLSPHFHSNDDWQDSLEERPLTMSQELERYKTLCVAQEAEIARLQQGYKYLKEWIKDSQKHLPTEGYGWTDYEYIDADDLLNEINHITGG